MASDDRALRAVFGARQGTVIDFDSQIGLGTVRDTAGDTWSFHCTSITNGTREIPSGAAVTFRVWPGPLGIEATNVSAV